MSASYVVDLGFTTQSMPSFPSTSVAVNAGVAISSGGVWSSLSGVSVGDVVDMINANSMTNLYVAGRSLGSGPLLVGVQTSQSTASGTFTDPTSGLAQLPTTFQSGGMVIIGSGGWTVSGDPGGILSSGVSGQYALSGFMVFAGFQRPGRYARVIVYSGFMNWANCQAGFVGMLKETGSGGGQTQSPGSGAVNV
jgi:hypothetical protein